MDKDDVAAMGVIAIAFAYIAFWIAVPVAAIYVLIHFIHKIW